MKKNIPYGHQLLGQDDIDAVAEALRGDWLTQGPKIAEFENAMAEYCGVKYAVAVSSGTAALHAAYAAAGIVPGDEIITTPLTFSATAAAAVYCGGRPVFADIQKDTLNIDPREIKKRITKKTKAIAPVDFAGHPCDYDKIVEIAREHDILVIGDAAHSLGSEYNGRKTGSLADMTILSFHPVKTITSGEGGMVLTENKDFYEKAKIFRQHGAVKKPEKGGWYYEIENLGYNYRITDFQCALGLSQLKKLDRFIERRREIALAYDEAFKIFPEIKIHTEKEYARSAWHLYVVRFNLELLKADRKIIFEELQKKNIGVQVHYIPLHFQPFYQKSFCYKPGDFPIAEDYYRRAISLPLFPGMGDADVEEVIAAVKDTVQKYKI